jgi:cytochrome c-type biogenesis protein CcmH
MIRPLAAVLLAVLLVVGTVPPGFAALDPREMLADPAQEARARDISKGLRCLVCQNQSIDDSNAELARDLRLLVRERIAAGDTNDQVLAFVTARYGDYVLLTPPLKPETLLLWIGPGLVFLAAAVGAFFYLRRRPAGEAAKPLTEAERQRLRALLDDRT